MKDIHHWFFICIGALLVLLALTGFFALLENAGMFNDGKTHPLYWDCFIDCAKWIVSIGVAALMIIIGVKIISAHGDSL